jgi:hypothetical protein
VAEIMSSMDSVQTAWQRSLLLGAGVGSRMLGSPPPAWLSWSPVWIGLNPVVGAGTLPPEGLCGAGTFCPVIRCCGAFTPLG